MKTKISQVVAAAALIGLAGSASAATVQLTGTFTDYRQLGVNVPLTGVTAAVSTWPEYDSNRVDAGAQVLTFSVSATLEVVGGVVVSGVITQTSTLQNDFFGSGGGSRGEFTGIVWEYLGGTTLSQQVGSGAGVTGTCTFQSGTTGGTGCAGALAALQTESAGSIFGNWNGIGANLSVSNLFGDGGPVNVSPDGDRPGMAWSVGGLNPGDVISAVLLKGAPATPATFNSAYAASLNLQVVPLPASVWLLASGVGLLGYWRRRKRAVS